MDQVNFRMRPNFRNDRPDGDSFIDLDKLWSAVVRRLGVIIACVAAAVVLAGIYLFTAQPVYTAMTQILIDENLSRFAEEEDSSQTAQQIDNRMSSAVEILKSKALALRVVDNAQLDQNEILVNPPQGPVDLAKSTVRSVVSALLPGGPPATEEAMRAGRREKAAAILQQSLTVERVGRSSVIAVATRSPDARLSALIAKTYASAYLEEQLNANFDATERASVWLQERLTDLNTRSQQASLAVEQYKTEHGLVSPRGELMSTQQLSDLNSQLIVAQADAATASARYEQYKVILDQGQEAAVSNAVVSSRDTDNSILQDLRKRFISINEREQAIVQQFGADHPQAVALKAGKADLSRQIYTELEQLTGSFRNEFEVASSRERSLRDSIEKVAGRNSEANVSMVQLSELEQKAAALKTLYQSYLARFEQASQQQSFPIAKARVISEAGVPTAPSSPRKTLTMALSLVLGLLAGGAIAGFLEFRERFFRTGEDVQDKLGMRFLGYLPHIGGQKAQASTATEAETLPQTMPEGERIDFRQMMRVAVESPRSSFAETLRNTRLACDIVLQGRKCRIIGVVSCLPGEGKSTVAANFAGLLAASGLRTLVIDGDLRNPGLSKMLATEPETGIVEVALQETEWTKAVRVDRRSKLAIMPVATRGKTLAHTSELLSSNGMTKFLESVRETFDVIVVDLAPLAPVIDAKAFEPHVDGFVFVAKWGVTPVKTVQNVLDSDPQIASKVIGVILNDTEMSRLSRYADAGAPEQFREQYMAYYQN
ncbi:polysaccharide biosynthesis tyrosine autokinase [Neorhizobium sp. T786]|uniref:polysaccharide biosynthesis tyrosine autokinase n=1 Tax=Pseudorhizobium xiangyangii TaxID=2883104 RepID=UPI001CFFB1DA|nr:polysaccharide biosynthesis tyrosine autokinase [Neorhizobium xiangyangii]MCB5204882.1 polysaccharide biosynthesis tyrosine autokinase [Neorhizobium xiangyangii]